MGNKPSTQSRVSAHESDVRYVNHSHLDEDLDDKCQHPAKRRRLDTNDGFPLYEDPNGDAPRCLRIEVLKIIHKDSPRIKNGVPNGMVAPNVRDTVNMRARCKLSIFGHKADDKVLLHVDSQLCELKVYKNPAAASTHMARLYAIKAFDIPEDKIYLERDDNDPAFGFADSYSVLIEIESAGDPNWPPSSLIPTITGEHDPLARNLPPRQWALSAQLPDIFHTRNRKTARLKARIQQNRETPTDFVMDIDVRWQTSISSQLTGNQKPKEIMPSITVIDPWAPKKPLSELPVNGSNGVNGINGHHGPKINNSPTKLGNLEVNGTSTADGGEELAEGDLTPNRSRRQRTDINYNVRQLWNTAVGKSPRKRKRDDEEQQLDEHSVTYVLEGGEGKPCTVNNLSCVKCYAEHERISQLRAHFSCHPEYEFKFEQKKGQYMVTVRPVPDYLSTILGEQPEEQHPAGKILYSLGLPVKPLDLSRFVDGDDSWVRSRLLPDHGGYPKPPPPLIPAHRASASRSPTKSVTTRTGSSTRATSSTTKDNNKSTKPIHTKKPVHVPLSITRPIYDPLSKAVLPPGSLVTPPPLDEGWLLNKHRDALSEFSDVTPAEKEYMMAWDAYIFPKHMSHELYLPREFRRFVQLKMAWLLEKRERMEELGKHMAVFLARGFLDDGTVDKVVRELSEGRKSMATSTNSTASGAAAEGGGAGAAGGTTLQARGQQSQVQQGQEQQPGGSTARKTKSVAGGCAICGEVVPQPEMMICCNKVSSPYASFSYYLLSSPLWFVCLLTTRNQDCKQRISHNRCLPNPDEARELNRRRKWKCAQCEAAGL